MCYTTMPIAVDAFPLTKASIADRNRWLTWICGLVADKHLQFVSDIPDEVAVFTDGDGCLWSLKETDALVLFPDGDTVRVEGDVMTRVFVPLLTPTQVATIEVSTHATGEASTTVQGPQSNA